MNWKNNNLFVGKWTVGRVVYAGWTSASDPKKWKAVCLLPGIDLGSGLFEKKEDAVHLVETAAERWLKLAELKLTD